MAAVELQPREVDVESGGYAKGVAVAIVRENKDSSGLGRVRVSYPWHDQPRESYWARIAAPMAGKDQGLYLLPEVDQEVLVCFERGDVRFPYVIGCLWNGKEQSPVKNDDGKNDQRILKTRKGHKLAFDDGSRGKLSLELNDGKKLEIDDDGIRLEDGKGNKLSIDSNGGAVQLEAVASLQLKAPKIAIEASASLSLKSDGEASLNGTLVRIN